jgi:hypothetical protein
MLFVKKEVDLDEIVAEARKWDDLYLNSTVHAVELYADPRQVKQVIQEFLSRKNEGAFKLTNPFSKRIWLKELLIAFYGSDDNPVEDRYFNYGRVPLMTGLQSGGVVCALVTFTDEAWACPDTAIEFDLKRAKQKVRNALKDLSYIAAFEAAYYVNESWKKNGKRGKLVSFHCHAVVWATHWSQLARRRKAIKPRFRPILGLKSGVRFDALRKANDVCKAVRYQAKMPARGYRTVAHDGGKKTQKSANLSYIQRYRLFNALQQHDLLDFWLAGGEGKNILGSARSKLVDHRRRLHERGLPVVPQHFPNSGPRRNRVGAF